MLVKEREHIEAGHLTAQHLRRPRVLRCPDVCLHPICHGANHPAGRKRTNLGGGYRPGFPERTFDALAKSALRQHVSMSAIVRTTIQRLVAPHTPPERGDASRPSRVRHTMGAATRRSAGRGMRPIPFEQDLNDRRHGGQRLIESDCPAHPFAGGFVLQVVDFHVDGPWSSFQILFASGSSF